MGQNRTTTKSNVLTKNVPTVTNAILSDILNADFADNICFRLDVAVAQSSSLSNITVDFAGRDRVDLTRTGGALNITLSGLEDGDVKYLFISKTAGQAVSFVGVTDVTPLTANVTSESSVLYEIIRKSSNYYARAVLNTVLAASGAETITGTITNKFVTPDGLQDKAATGAETVTGTSTTKFVTPDSLTDKKATSGLLGLVKPAFTPYTESPSDTDPGGNPLYINPSELERMFQLRFSGLGRKIIITSAFDWSSGLLNHLVAHGLSLSNIINVSVMIERADAQTRVPFSNAGTVYVSDLYVGMNADSGGDFDDPAYNASPCYIIIDHLY